MASSKEVNVDMELIISNLNEFPKAITFNKDDIMQELSLQLATYQNLVYTDEAIKSAKTHRATLNNLKTAIDDRRKDIKKECLVPYEQFEKDVKEVLALIDKPLLEIDKQVKLYEEKTKQDKKKQIEEKFQEEVATANLQEVLPISKIWSEKWLNATYKITDIEIALHNTVLRVKGDLEALSNVNSEFLLQVKDKYLQTLDMAVALKEKARLEERQKQLEQIESYNKKQAELKKEAIELEKKEQQQQLTPPDLVEQKQEQQQQLERLEFVLYVTPEQKQLLRQFIISNKLVCKKS
jgi:hypothetical protein